MSALHTVVPLWLLQLKKIQRQLWMFFILNVLWNWILHSNLKIKDACWLITVSPGVWKYSVSAVSSDWEGMVEPSIVPLAGAVHGSESVNAWQPDTKVVNHLTRHRPFSLAAASREPPNMFHKDLSFIREQCIFCTVDLKSISRLGKVWYKVTKAEMALFQGYYR